MILRFCFTPRLVAATLLVLFGMLTSGRAQSDLASREWTFTSAGGDSGSLFVSTATHGDDFNFDAALYGSPADGTPFSLDVQGGTSPGAFGTCFNGSVSGWSDGSSFNVSVMVIAGSSGATVYLDFSDGSSFRYDISVDRNNQTIEFTSVDCHTGDTETYTMSFAPDRSINTDYDGDCDELSGFGSSSDNGSGSGSGSGSSSGSSYDGDDGCDGAAEAGGN